MKIAWCIGRAKFATNEKRLKSSVGFRTNANMQALCPFYEQVVKSGKSGRGFIAGVQCNYPHKDLGFDASVVIRFKTWREVRAYMDLFCFDLYEQCPYYQVCERAEVDREK